MLIHFASQYNSLVPWKATYASDLLQLHTRRTMARLKTRRLGAAFLTTLGAAQGTLAVVQVLAECEEQFSWMGNSFEQSTCAIAAYLLSACNGGST